jgi:hypothetical protein
MKPMSATFRTAGPPVFAFSFLLGLAAASFLGLHRALSVQEFEQRNALSVAAFLAPAVADADAQKLTDTLKSRDAEIQSVQLISKQDAYQDAQKDPALAKSLVLLKENPLPASLLIHYSDRAWLERGDPNDSLKAISQIQEIRWDPQTRANFRRAHEWGHWLLQLGELALGMLVLAALFGFYQFLSRRRPSIILAIHAGLGVAGAASACLALSFLARRLGDEAAMQRPALALWPPLLMGALAGIALVGGWDCREE